MMLMGNPETTNAFYHVEIGVQLENIIQVGLTRLDDHDIDADRKNSKVQPLPLRHQSRSLNPPATSLRDQRIVYSELSLSHGMM